MLEINFIRENKELIKDNIKKRMAHVDLDKLFELDEKRRSFTKDIEDKRAFRNKKSKGKPSDEEIVSLKKLGEEINILEDQLEVIQNEYIDLLKKVPNMTHPDTPVGDENNFNILEIVGKAPKFDFEPKNHEEIMLDLDMIDFERGAKVVGSKWFYFKNDAVLLERALISYGIDILTKYGYKLMITPDLAKESILFGAGYNPRGDEKQIYNIEGEDLSLIGTSEITLAGFHSNEVLDLSKGPIKYAGLSHCFRTEAGAYGKTSKGLYRIHQFTKLEMFVFCKPEDSEAIHKELLKIEQEICNGLGIPYRIIDIASGDLGGPAYRKFDLEAWMTMVDDGGGYGEITSASNCTDYQARRLNIKYKKENGETEFVHTLNGTGITSSRFPIAVIENFQQEDGSILIPKKLQPFFGKEKITKA